MDETIRADALDVLRDAQVWRLTDSRWKAVQEAVHALARAWEANDAEVFREAVYDLELAGPARATGYGDNPTIPAPEPVRERIDKMVHSLANPTSVHEHDSDDGTDPTTG